MKKFEAEYNRKPHKREWDNGYNIGRGYWYLKYQYARNKLDETITQEFKEFET